MQVVPHGGDPVAETADAGDPRIHLTPIRRFGMTFVPLSRRPGGVQAFKMIIPAQPEPPEPTPQTHDGFEWLYVLNGHLRLVLGERDLTLPPGEAAEFDTSSPHWLGSADDCAVELLILFDPQGMRTHIHADPTDRLTAEAGGELSKAVDRQRNLRLGDP
ncbi:mannose-6-phosphate isomerase-like protein (cupin superfamily) [Saccharothrix ecbatanensis]|uniref:Mannose-6-phosphate isomerase-like protein (Cupin superfamily) n=1 Tax=Saccharothrix ecbatanensis TaxID=1105145 RepID=A0A7W9HG31_9PSEU|nr:mannose-6-phosphate isomerase-like protein (cupin superfamily) [Saccharothrix ecbatanensis]